MAQGDLYGKVYGGAFGGNITWGTSVKCALLGASYTPLLNVDQFWSDISANEASGTGYTSGGAALASPTSTMTVANSWSTQWQATHSYATAYAVVRPTTGNGYLYRATATGTSSGSEPTWPTVIGAAVTDSGVTWTCIGTAITVLGATNPSWDATGGSLTARYAAFYFNTGTAGTSRLIGLVDQGSAVTATNASFTVQADGNVSGFFPFFSS